MPLVKADIIAGLKKEILYSQGFKATFDKHSPDVALGPLKNAFPGNRFPVGAVHEFISAAPEDSAVTEGFIAGILASLMRQGHISIWIGSSRTIFPPAFRSFGIDADKIIFIDLKKEREMLWAMEEALKCDGLAAVVGDIPELSFTASRRLQLAVEKSRVTGFILRRSPRQLNTTACIARWKITSLPSEAGNDLPGVGFPRWNVELLRVRNGKPGSWQVEFAEGRFRPVYTLTIVPGLRRKTG